MDTLPMCFINVFIFRRFSLQLNYEEIIVRVMYGETKHCC